MPLLFSLTFLFLFVFLFCLFDFCSMVEETVDVRGVRAGIIFEVIIRNIPSTDRPCLQITFLFFFTLRYLLLSKIPQAIFCTVGLSALNGIVQYNPQPSYKCQTHEMAKKLHPMPVIEKELHVYNASLH